MSRRFGLSRPARRKIISLLFVAGLIIAINFIPRSDDPANFTGTVDSPAGKALEKLAIKGRAPKTNYARSQFGDGWESKKGCDTRNRILRRDLKNITYSPTIDVVVCIVNSGTLYDLYTNKTISFTRGSTTSSAVQIDHVVALSDAWQKGAQSIPFETRRKFANDPLNLLAVDGPTNMNKSDSDAATWLPPNKPYRCQYVARQVAVKLKYKLWVTEGERDAIARVLSTCPGQNLPN